MPADMYYGTQYMNDATFPFWIRRFLHTHDSRPPLHQHDFVELVFVVRGEGNHLFEGTIYPIRSGDIFIINPGEAHTYEVAPREQIEIINCLFRPVLIQESIFKSLGIFQSMDYFYVHPFLNSKERFHHQLNLREQEARRVLSLIETMLMEFNERASGYDTLIRLHMVELLILLSRYYQRHQTNESLDHNQDAQNLIRRICGYIERHYDEKINRTSLAYLFRISSRQLNRIFKKETGVPVVAMIQRVRMNQAKKLLLETNEKIITVAGLVGYDDAAFFSKLFSRQEGCSPGDYRKKNKITI